MYDVVLYCILRLVNLETTGNHKKELLCIVALLRGKQPGGRRAFALSKK